MSAATGLNEAGRHFLNLEKDDLEQQMVKVRFRQLTQAVAEIIGNFDLNYVGVDAEKCFDCENERTCEIRRTMQMVRDAMAKVLDGTSLADAISMDSKVASTLRYAFAQ